MAELARLMEMGFSREHAESALLQTSFEGVEEALEWLISHTAEESECASGDHSGAVTVDIQMKDEKQSTESGEPPASEAIPPATVDTEASDIPGGASAFGEKNKNLLDDDDDAYDAVSRYIFCEECSAKLCNEAAMDQHALRTGHAMFSVSQKDADEDKKEQLKKVEDLIKQRRAERNVEEQRDEVTKERERRRAGQELSIAKQKLEEQEAIRAVEMKKREKLEARLTRQKILEEIEKDKRDRKARFMYEGSSTLPKPPDEPQAATRLSDISETTQPERDYKICRLQIRLSNGDVLVHTFSANEELAAVRLYVEMNRTDGSGSFSLMTAFPKQIFNEEHMSCPLHALGLVPAAVLTVTKINN